MTPMTVLCSFQRMIAPSINLGSVLGLWWQQLIKGLLVGQAGEDPDVA